MRELGMAWAEELGTPAPTMLVGHRARYGSLALAAGLTQGLCAGGVDVIDVGLVTPDHLTWLSATLDAPAVLAWIGGDQRQCFLPLLSGAWGLEPARVRALQRRAGQIEAGAERVLPSRLGQMSSDDTRQDFVAHLQAQADVAWLRPLRIGLDVAERQYDLARAVLDVPDVTVVEAGRRADATVALLDDHLIVRDERGLEVPTQQLAPLVAADACDEERPWGFRALWGASSPLLAALRVVSALGHADVPLSELVDRPGAMRLEVSDPARALLAVSRGFGRHAVVVEQQAESEHPCGLLLRGDAGRRGPWQLVVRPGPGASLIDVVVEARDDVVMAAVRDDVRAIIESAA